MLLWKWSTLKKHSIWWYQEKHSEVGCQKIETLVATIQHHPSFAHMSHATFNQSIKKLYCLFLIFVRSCEKNRLFLAGYLLYRHHICSVGYLLYYYYFYCLHLHCLHFCKKLSLQQDVRCIATIFVLWDIVLYYYFYCLVLQNIVLVTLLFSSAWILYHFY